VKIMCSNDKYGRTLKKVYKTLIQMLKYSTNVKTMTNGKTV